MAEVREELKYSKDHEWVIVEGKRAKIGISDYAQDSLGDIVFIELPEVGREITANENIGVVESVKAVSDIYIPVSGTVVEVNEALEDSPELINESPYDEGWICIIEMSDSSELEQLLSAKEYDGFTKEEE
ncbi:glycine cleavage system protein GcvH [Desulfuribacillus alkaliarsenatis]|uniref:Glycine cleavage system H protein n=1 Tax=Desulfuribacillus alkaliarsenatis TaxID=766136 RepID=A0A1E5G5H3_9FIRM|nr:glycine cleavage system protein GcvH [Desulfuribacillus alkaliarsenatis]OEF98416.1 glycine cleavage system protein H [Desulfuribacillus alkaliarsenatis]